MSYTFDLKKDYNKISRKTGVILTKLYLEYIANEEEKEEIKKMLLENSKILDESKEKNYSIENIFKSKPKAKDDSVDLIIVKQKKWYKSLFLYIRNKFKKH